MRNKKIIPILWFLASGLLLPFLIIQCKKEEKPIPPCIQQKIDSIRNAPKSDPPVEIHAWDYAGRRVYLVSTSNTGDSVKVFEADCRYVCAPSGGATGTGDTLCPDFYRQAQHRQLLWKDDR